MLSCFALVPEIKLIPRLCIGVEYQSLEFSSSASVGGKTAQRPKGVSSLAGEH